MKCILGPSCQLPQSVVPRFTPQSSPPGIKPRTPEPIRPRYSPPAPVKTQIKVIDEYLPPLGCSNGGRGTYCCTNGANNPNCCTEKDPLCQQRTTERRLVAPGVACENVTETRGAKANCMFDVFTTGNEDFATTISAYTDPIPDEPSSQCTEGGLNDCQTLNGVCVWRCDSTKAECRPNLCVANASGVQNSECSCMIPFDGICDNIFLAIINLFFGWLLAFFGIDLCP